jgi:hypothetical protein
MLRGVARCHENRKHHRRQRSMAPSADRVGAIHASCLTTPRPTQKSGLDALICSIIFPLHPAPACERRTVSPAVNTGNRSCSLRPGSATPSAPPIMMPAA